MADAKASPPKLFSQDGVSTLPDRPSLLGGRCADCGYIFFPMQSYGCERCGSQHLESAPLAGRGKLIASAKVFMSAGEYRPAPFTVGSLITDDGAVVRSILELPEDASLAPGVEMVTKLVPENRPDRGEFDLRFVRATEA